MKRIIAVPEHIYALVTYLYYQSFQQRASLSLPKQISMIYRDPGFIKNQKILSFALKRIMASHLLKIFIAYSQDQLSKSYDHNAESMLYILDNRKYFREYFRGEAFDTRNKDCGRISRIEDIKTYSSLS